MAGPAQAVELGMTDADKRYFDFVQTLLRISDDLTERETADVKLYCMRLIPRGSLEKLERAADIFFKLKELGKIDEENLDFIAEILERIGRKDLVTGVLLPFQPPDREIPENPELQPGTSWEDASTSADGTATSNTYVVVHGHQRMTQEALDQLKNNLASLCRTRKSRVMFRGVKKHKSILVHFTIPRENTAVLRLMANHSDPRLVYMGVKSLQIDAELPIEIDITQGALLFDIKRQLPVDDIEVGCSTRKTQQMAPNSWSSLSALNLFSDALPLHLQIAASLQYQGFSYSLVQALVQKDQLREHQMNQLIQKLKKTEVDSDKADVATKARLADDDRTTPGQGDVSYKMGDDSAYVSKDESALPGSEEPQETISGKQTREKKRIKSARVEGAKPTGDPQKSFITFGLQGSKQNRSQKPRGVVVSSSNEIFVADLGNGRVQIHNTEGVYLRHFTAVVPGTEDKEMMPHDVAIDGNGTLWVVGEGDTAEHVVQYSTDGTAMTQFDLPKINHYRGIAVDARLERIVVTEDGRDRGEVLVFRPDGSLVRRFGHSEMRNPRYITVDGEGNIFASDWRADYVYVYDESGKFLLKFGGKGKAKGQLRSPRGICTDASGHIIIADTGNEMVQIFTRHGEYVRHIHTGYRIDGIAVGPGGHLVLTNFLDNTVTILPAY
ncbi:TRIM3 [Branchiostoma lanceolatum]|uniref:TRIM3 protein n=1 Tax=Branchiostoma lanceolatum TaxID=7740 RepID=A0A8J9YZ95_BRALA|nr:TRIM3 [Branchiostoma lanceolatum]